VLLLQSNPHPGSVDLFWASLFTTEFFLSIHYRF